MSNYTMKQIDNVKVIGRFGSWFLVIMSFQTPHFYLIKLQTLAFSYAHPYCTIFLLCLRPPHLPSGFPEVIRWHKPSLLTIVAYQGSLSSSYSIDQCPITLIVPLSSSLSTSFSSHPWTETYYNLPP